MRVDHVLVADVVRGKRALESAPTDTKDSVVGEHRTRAPQHIELLDVLVEERVRRVPGRAEPRENDCTARYPGERQEQDLLAARARCVPVDALNAGGEQSDAADRGNNAGTRARQEYDAQEHGNPQTENDAGKLGSP